LIDLYALAHSFESHTVALIENDVGKTSKNGVKQKEKSFYSNFELRNFYAKTAMPLVLLLAKKPLLSVIYF
jgi:hypothetical protein|tara:strand:- start:40 stop:252 length:213 start_codon:yes stop_codon:yes gene_type:complete